MKFRAHILAIIILTVGCFVLLPDLTDAQVQVKRDTRKAKQLRDQADKAYRQKNYGDAVKLYAESITFDPQNADAHYWKGYAHQYLKEYDDALVEFKTSLELGYKAIDVYRIRSYVNYEKKDYEAASEDVKQVLAVDPNNVLFLRLSAEINLELKRYDDALASYQKLSAASPNDGNLQYSVARIYFTMGNAQAQASAAELAIQKGTQFLADAHLLAADGYQKQGRIQEAEASYLKSLDSKPDNKEIYRTLADMYRSQSRFDDAIAISRRALRLYPFDGGFHTDISWYFSLAGRHEEAIQSAQAGIRFQPDQYMAYTNLCRAYNDVNKPDLAISACNGALKLKADDGETYFYLARANDLLNRPAEATRLYKRAVAGLISFTRENPTYSDAFYLLGNAYFADNQLEKAIEAYQKCLEMSPRFARARYNVGMVQLQLKNKSGATEQYNLLMGIDRVLAGKLKVEIDKTSDRP